MKKLTTVKDLDVLLSTGGSEPSLFFKEEKKDPVKMTINSGIYENRLGEFIFDDELGEGKQEKANLVLHELAADGSIEKVNRFTFFELKDEHIDKMLDLMGLSKIAKLKNNKI